MRNLLLSNNKRGATLIEIMAMLTMLALVLTAMFTTLIQGMDFSRDTEARIQAINIAREWIEAVTNIRNTNWLRFPSGRTNCWDILGRANCFDSSSSKPVFKTGSYVLHQWNGVWFLSGVEAWGSSVTGAYSTYNLGVNGSGVYIPWSQLPLNSNKNCNIDQKTNCRSMFFREIIIQEKTETGMIVTATVYWRNKGHIRKVSLNTTLTNWKSHYDPGK